MSALARYFNAKGWQVAGYDKTPSSLTAQLESEGIAIHYEDLGPVLPESFRNPNDTLVVITPAIPNNLGELLHVLHMNYPLLKRAEVLGLLTRIQKGLGVAGTHGKTTTSTLLAHILNSSSVKCSAFLGGIASNFNSNVLIDTSSPYVVIEADEFDRSFLQLNPFASIITSADPDHLDIYGSKEEFQSGFQAYANKVDPHGFLVKKFGLDLSARARVISYGLEQPKADYNACDLSVVDGHLFFSIESKDKKYTGLELGISGVHNVENATACWVLCEQIGVSEAEIRFGLKSFLGVKRRFEYKIKSQNLIFIDDYAHHPTEIAALMNSVKMLYPTKKVTAIFQPHLFTRTRDFFDGFAEELSKADEVVLLPIYPAREEPIDGVSSDVLLKALSCEKKVLLQKEELLDYFSGYKEGVVLTIGAGDIDRLVDPLKAELQ